MSLYYGVEYLLVGVVCGGDAEGFQIDVCGAFGGVSHGFADGRHGDVLALGDACPGVACYVGGEFGAES